MGGNFLRVVASHWSLVGLCGSFLCSEGVHKRFASNWFYLVNLSRCWFLRNRIHWLLWWFISLARFPLLTGTFTAIWFTRPQLDIVQCVWQTGFAGKRFCRFGIGVWPSLDVSQEAEALRFAVARPPRPFWGRVIPARGDFTWQFTDCSLLFLHGLLERSDNKRFVVHRWPMQRQQRCPDNLAQTSPPIWKKGASECDTSCQQLSLWISGVVHFTFCVSHGLLSTAISRVKHVFDVVVFHCPTRSCGPLPP